MNMFVFIIYAGFVTYSSLSQISSVTHEIKHIDKLYHFIAYGIFTLLAFRISKTKRVFYIICVGIVGYSGLMEIGQSFVPNRSMSLYDLISNSVGVILVCIIVNKYYIFNEEQISSKKRV